MLTTYTMFKFVRKGNIQDSENFAKKWKMSENFKVLEGLRKVLK